MKNLTFTQWLLANKGIKYYELNYTELAVEKKNYRIYTEIPFL